MNILTKEQLLATPTKRLLAILKVARAIRSDIANHAGYRCCEICHEYVGEDWEKDVGIPLKPWKDYCNLIKEILKDRPHVERKRMGTASRSLC